MGQTEKKHRHTDLMTMPVTSGQVRNRLPRAREGLRIINPTDKDVDDYKDDFKKKPRLHYTGMRAHMEMSAQALAVGATQKMAAHYAGVSNRQIKKYMGDPDFRQRIEELRSLVASRIRGKIFTELNRRTSKKQIKRMEVMDLVRILDRTSGQGGKGMAITVEGDMNVGNRYEQVLAALFASDAEGDGEDLPQFGDRGIPIPGQSTPVER